ncbi:MAG TPA: integrase family protein, partial [Phenylobacterium sp.]|nr:integrase family protein [Phenylobacterium sp.]
MKQSRVRLTRRIVESAEPGPKDRFMWDSDVAAFGVRIWPSGHRVYVLQYRSAGRLRRYNIGPHGSPWTVETARDRAKVLLGQVASGEDPQDAKASARKEFTVAQLCDLYLTEGLATRKETSVASARSDIENHIKPLLGSKRASLVTRQDVDQLLAAVAAGKTRRTVKTGKKRGLSRVKGGKGAANSAVVTLSAAMGFAVARGIRHDNPALRVRRFPEKKLERFLSPAEIARLGEALAAAEAIGVEPAAAIAAIRLLILTGCRKNEILTLQRSHVDAHHRCLRLPDSKTGHKIVHIGL